MIRKVAGMNERILPPDKHIAPRITTEATTSHPHPV